MHACRLLVLITTIAIVPPAALAQVAHSTDLHPPVVSVGIADAITDRIAREIEAQHIVGISVALVKDGRILETRHFGWEDRDNEIRTSDATMYRWASISKPLTAIVAMQLWEQGRMDLDGDVREYIPQFPEQAGQIITSRQLLCHQGCIVHYTNGAVIPTPRPDLDGRYIDIIDALDTFKASPLVCEPGASYSYTTHGYILLGAAVQRAGEQPYPEQVRERIILPLGMSTLRPDYQWEEISNRTIGYRRARPPRGGADGMAEDGQAAEVRMIPSTNTDVSWKLAGGGWISNVTDLALLSVGMLSHQLVKPETREQVWMRQSTAGGEETAYGLGFRVERLDGRLMVSHGGSQEKTRTLLAMLPDEGAAIAIMCNTEGTNLVPLGRDLLRILIGSAVDAAADLK
jgi:serine beta-lactamase-like protein LACTB, mitochondrial